MTVKRMNIEDCRDSFLMYSTQLEQAYDLYEMAKTEKDYKNGLEFCIASMETMLTGKTSSDNDNIKMTLRGYASMAKSNIRKWEIEKEKTRINGHWYEVAQCYNDGMKNKDIAKELGLSESRISQILAEIRVDEPELLEKL